MPDPSNAPASSTPDEKTEVLPETAVQLVEMERLKTELAGAEERAKNHWDQYLRALADVDNVRKAMFVTRLQPSRSLVIVPIGNLPGGSLFQLIRAECRLPALGARAASFPLIYTMVMQAHSER